MPQRIGVPKKKPLRKKKRKAPPKKKRRLSRRPSPFRAPGVAPKRRTPGVAEAGGEPPFVPLLFFSDVDAAMHFFTVKLGFDLLYQRHTLHGYTGLCAVRYPGVYLLLGHAEGLEADGQAAFAANAHGVGVRFVINVADVDVLHRELAARGVATDGAPRQRLWGHKEFSLADPLEGYRFTFSQPAPA
jgi:uncharacterized glyoxalase superfamily protein PhnB